MDVHLIAFAAQIMAMQRCNEGGDPESQVEVNKLNTKTAQR